MVRLKLIWWNLINWAQQSMLMASSIRRWSLVKMGCDIHPTARIASGVFIGSNKLHLASNVFVNINCFLDGCDCVVAEEFVRIGPYVKILTGTHTVNHGVLRRSGTSETKNRPVTIKRGSWIGMGAIILPGVTIAEGCVIAAGSVVIRSTTPNGMYAGNPAMRIKELPTE